MELKKKLDEEDEDLLLLAITEIRQRFGSSSKEVYVPFSIDLGESIKVTVPKLGDKKHILDLSTRNAKYFRLERLKQIKIVDPDRHANRIMAQMKAEKDEETKMKIFNQYVHQKTLMEMELSMSLDPSKS